MNSEETQPYIYMYPFSPKPSKRMGFYVGFMVLYHGLVSQLPKLVALILTKSRELSAP